MTSLADVMANLQDSERTLATARQWASERVSDCHESLVVLDALDQAFRCWQCGRECEPVLPVEKETTVPDDTEGVRKMAEDWWISVCPECNGRAEESSQAHNETCPNRRRLRMFVPRAVEVVPLERAEKAEAAARELRATVQLTKDALGWIAPWDLPPSKRADRNEALASAREALARHPGYAPEGKGNR